MPFGNQHLRRSMGPSILFAASLAITGCATAQPQEENSRPMTMQAAPEPTAAASAVATPPPAVGALDPTRFCYYEGQAYSPGATRGGLVCAEPEGLSVYSANRQPKPLQWLPVQP